MPAKGNRFSFTLIELMLVIALIAIGLGTLAFQVSKALKAERFERGVEHIIQKISLAQEIMLDFHTDVTLTLKQSGQAVECQLEAACVLPAHIEKGLNHASRVQGIEQMTLDNTVSETIKLPFEASLGITPQAQITFNYLGRQAILCLPGYPAAIKRGHYEITTNESHYPEEILSAL